MRSIAVKRTVFDVDISRTAVREIVWRSIPEMSIELFSKFTLGSQLVRASLRH